MKSNLLLAMMFCSAVFLGASQQCPLAGRFQVSGQSAAGYKDKDEPGPMALVVRNVSSSGVIGFVVRVDFLAPRTGSPVSYRIVEALRGTPDGKRLPIPPGGTVTLRRTTLPSVREEGQVEPKITFDVVVYSDGSHWGPATLDLSKALLSKTTIKHNQDQNPLR